MDGESTSRQALGDANRITHSTNGIGTDSPEMMLRRFDRPSPGGFRSRRYRTMATGGETGKRSEVLARVMRVDAVDRADGREITIGEVIGAMQGESRLATPRMRRPDSSRQGSADREARS